VSTPTTHLPGPALGARLRWYASRVAGMSGPELAHRLRELRRRIASRHTLPDLSVWVRADPAPPLLPRLADGVGAVAQDAAALERWQALAAHGADGRYAALGVDWPPSKRRPGAAFPLPDWHLDPLSGQRWPADAYCFDAVVRHPTDGRDPRYVRELGRLQYLQPIAALAAVSEDLDQVALCAAHIQDWIERNPPGRGVHWASGHDIALRAVSLIVVSTLIGERFDAGLRRQILLALAQHGYWLARFPSLFAAADHRLVAEAGGLYLIGSLAPTLRPAPRWATLGRELLEHEILAQLQRDGGGAAQAPAVTAHLIDWLLLCGHVGQYLGRPFSAAFWERLTAAGAHLRALVDAGGNVPRIGEDGEDRLLFDPADGGELAGVLGSLALAAGRPELAPPHVVPQLRHALTGVPAPAAQPAPGVRHFPQGGLTAVRAVEDGIESLLVFDHGPVGLGPAAPQGHADTLSVWLHLDGRPVLVDAGSGVRRGDAVWRGHFRGTTAHNTLSINGEDSSLAAGPEDWLSTARCTVTQFNPDPERWAVEAEHDGFLAGYGYRHRRRVERGGPGLIVVTDQLIGSGGVERVEVGFLVAPDLSIVSSAGGWVIGDGRTRLLYIRHEGPLKGWVERGSESGRRGWHVAGYGRRAPAPRLVFAGKLWHGAVAKFTLSTGL
jgi:uncharacterized heparinase superfamily protein